MSYLRILICMFSFSIVLSGCAVISLADKRLLKRLQEVQTAGDCVNKILEIPECQETADTLEDIVK